ncbi:uncharacterized protein DUF1131 [Enterobacter sp. AG5470]|nr:uncharacterized protein DUF1131 [Enterobacter sp. AG5470]
MKSLRMVVCVLPLALAGCSTLSSVNWSAAYPWNWFGSSVEVSDNGVGNITAATPLTEQAISDALKGDYRLRSGMKTEKGVVVRYFEALRDDQLALVVNGENGAVSRIDVLDHDIASDKGVKVGTPFTELYDKAFGNCVKATGDDSDGVECKAPGSQHISYVFTGEWSGPEGLMPADDVLKNWKVSKLIWRR